MTLLNKTKVVFSMFLSLPVCGFNLCAKERVVEVEGHTLPCRRFFRHLWQTENHPGMNFSKTELPHQTELVHWPETEMDRDHLQCS